jgi:serine/threonine protein kinase
LAASPQNCQGHRYVPQMHFSVQYRVTAHRHHTAKGCAFLHGISPPILHRDIKSPNILVLSLLFSNIIYYILCILFCSLFVKLADLSPNASVVAKVCDFGVSLCAAGSTATRKVTCPGSPPPPFVFLVQSLCRGLL